MIKNNVLSYKLNFILFFIPFLILFSCSKREFALENGKLVEDIENVLRLYISELDEGKIKAYKGELETLFENSNSIAEEFKGRLYLAKSIYYERNLEYREALEELDKIIKLNSIEKDIALINRGVILEKMGNTDEAILAYEMAQNKSSQNYIKVQSMLYRASLLEKIDKNKAKEVYEEILRLDFADTAYVNIAQNRLFALL